MIVSLPLLPSEKVFSFLLRFHLRAQKELRLSETSVVLCGCCDYSVQLKLSAVSLCPWVTLPVCVTGPLQAGSCWNRSWKCRDAPVLKLIQEDVSVLWQSWQVLNVLILLS